MLAGARRQEVIDLPLLWVFSLHHLPSLFIFQHFSLRVTGARPPACSLRALGCKQHVQKPDKINEGSKKGTSSNKQLSRALPVPH